MEVINKIYISGQVEVEPEYSHEVKGEFFWKTTIMVKRKSDVADYITVIFPQKLIRTYHMTVGTYIEVSGRFSKWQKQYFVFASYIAFSEKMKHENFAEIKGFICEEPIFVKTDKGREITRICIASNRFNGKSDYIRCIAWGRNAYYSSSMNVGEEIYLIGRVQSRIFYKDDEERLTHEVSVQQIEKVGLCQKNY